MQVDQPIPLSPVQRRFWVLQQLETHRQDNFISVAYQAPGELDHQQLQQRLNYLLDSNAALRMVSSMQGDEIIQKIMPNAERCGVYVTKLGGETTNVDEQIALAQKAVREQEPPFRVDLLLACTTSSLLLTASRMVCDVHSLECIAAYLLGVAQDIPHSTLDFASSLEKYTLSGQTNLETWAGMLRDATHVCELPLDQTRPSIQRGVSAAYSAPLSKNALTSIEYLARTYAVPQAVVCLAAYFSLLYRYTLQDDILIGLAHRPDAEYIPSIGPFTDTVVVRQIFEEGVTFAQLLTSLSATYAQVNAQRPPAFQLLLDLLKPERDLGRAPVVQNGFEFLDAGVLPLSGHAQFKRTHASAGLHQLDIMLCLQAENDNLSALWHYDAAIFSAETIQRMQQHFEALLTSAMGNADKPVMQLGVITSEEKELITVQWNTTASSVDDHDFVYRLFEKQAARTPTAIAAREPGNEITYEALNRCANRMAHHLAEKGIGADSIVAILADRDIDYLITILAINKAGGAFLPLSPSYPARRLAQIFEKSDSTLVLVGKNYLEPVQEALQYMAPEQRPGIEVIISILEQSGPETNLPARCEMHHLAYVMFTSGSTGEPKGVMVHHAGNVNHVYAKIGDLEMGPNDILAQTSRQSFDIVVWQFVAPLINGGSIYIMPDEIALDPAHLLKESERVGVTVLQLVPVNIEALLDVADAMADQRPQLKSLRWMVPTGDALPTDLCRRWLGLYPHTQMLNTYGATECSDDQCHHVIATSPAPEYRPAVMTIGRPIINTQVYILDDAVQPVPVGVIGELYIAGVGVGRGYLKDAERTTKTFVHNPFSNDSNSKLYRSGDQARYLSDGTIEFIGRIGHMIKIRGMRLEPGEIQSVLGRHPQVAQATIIVHEFPELGAHLVAYLVFRKGEAVAEAELRTYLRQYLPDYMIPSYFVVIEAMPLNANGKIDRKALPIPEIAATKPTIVAPRTPTESSLLDTWRKILGRDTLSVHDNFFDVGGNSLLAMRLFSYIEQNFGQRLPLATIFRATTIAEQAALLNHEDTGRAQASLFSGLACIVPIQVGNPDRPPFFCVHAGGGHVIFFRDLARYLGEDQTFYGIQALGIDGTREPKRRYEDIAAVYVQEIRVVQPEGPYYIGGECLGGSLAFEVTRQLEAQGQQVNLLVMFDSYCAGIPTLRPGMPMWLYEIMFNIRRSRIYFAKLRNAPLGEKFNMLIDILQRTTYTFRRIFFGWLTVNQSESDPMSLTQSALNEAEHAYKPGIINIPITLFNSRLPHGVTNDETLGWQGHSHTGIDIHRLPTIFDMMIEGPDVKIAAEHLREVLDQKFSKQDEQGAPQAQ